MFMRHGDLAPLLAGPEADPRDGGIVARPEGWRRPRWRAGEPVWTLADGEALKRAPAGVQSPEAPADRATIDNQARDKRLRDLLRPHASGRRLRPRAGSGCRPRRCWPTCGRPGRRPKKGTTVQSWSSCRGALGAWRTRARRARGARRRAACGARGGAVGAVADDQARRPRARSRGASRRSGRSAARRPDALLLAGSSSTRRIRARGSAEQRLERPVPPDGRARSGYPTSRSVPPS